MLTAKEAHQKTEDLNNTIFESHLKAIEKGILAAIDEVEYDIRYNNVESHTMGKRLEEHLINLGYTAEYRSDDIGRTFLAISWWKEGDYV